MFAKLLTKYPVLIIGILFVVILGFDLNRRGYVDEWKNRFNPTSCRAAIVKLERRVPKTWTVSCKENNLLANVEFKTSSELKKDSLKIALYRELANNLIFLSKNSPEDNLERVDWVQLKMTSGTFVIDSSITGKNALVLSKITNKKTLAEFLKLNVQVKESF